MSHSDPHHPCAPRHPPAATRPGTEYFLAIDEDFGLFHFIIDTALRGDYIPYATRQALLGTKAEDILSEEEFVEKTPGPRLRFLRRKRQLFLEMYVARLVDTFQTYLVSLIRAVLRARPEMLASRQPTVTLEEILRHSSIEELLHETIERRVGGLSYEGFPALHSWCADRGIEIPVSDADMSELVELIATRNLIAHNRGLVDERYLKTVPGSPFSTGDRRTIEVDYFTNALARLQSLVEAIDAKAIEKFGLATEPVASPSNKAGGRDEGGDPQPADGSDEASEGH